MINISCRNCGRKNTITDEVININNSACKACGHKLIDSKPDTIVVVCENCNDINHVHYKAFDGWTCRSCCHENKHPSQHAIAGNGNSFGYEFQKTTINIPSYLLKELNKYLAIINEDAPIKIKRGEFIRLLLTKEFGLVYKRSK